MMSDAMEWIFDDFKNIQSTDWGWGVFYATDANSVDKRCVFQKDWNGFDCPGGYIDADTGDFFADDTKKGSGYYLPGNPDAKGDQGGGGTGCHFETNGIDQTDSDDPNGDLVGDKNCQCNYFYSGQWNKWVDAWSQHSEQRAGFEDRDWLNANGNKAPAWALDTAACWVNNPRDMIDLQNAIHWQHFDWNNELIPQTYWGTRESSELRKYWGWNEVPVSKPLADDPQQWDAIIIKLPADVCQDDWGSTDNPSCLSYAAQEQLSEDLDTYVQKGKLVPGADNLAKRPGSYVLFVRETGTVFDWDVGEFGVNWQREFFCANWVSPNKKYQVVHGDNVCYLDLGGAPTPEPLATTTTLAPGPTPEPTIEPTPEPTPEPTTPPVPAAQGIKNHEEVCLQTEQPPASGQPVTVAACDGSAGQDWSFDDATNAIIHNDLCLEALCLECNGGSLMLNDCQGNDRQHWEAVGQDDSWMALTTNGKRCLDVWSDTTTDTHGLWIWECLDGADNQKWQLLQTAWATV